MNLPISEIPFHTINRMNKAVKTSKQQGTYLPSYYNAFPVTNPAFVILEIIYIVILLLVNSWALFYWLLVSGPVLIYFLLRQLQCIWYWKRLDKDGMFFDNFYFISVSGKTLHLFPLISFKYSDSILAIDERNYIIRFHFSNGSINQPCKAKDSPSVQQFQNLLNQYISMLKQKETSINYTNHFATTFYEKLSVRRNPLIASLFILTILWFTLPNIIDNNAFNHAKNINTATSFRTYLSEPQNVKFRKDAILHIRRIYDDYISKYKTLIFSHSSGSEAFVKVLEYMRDNDIFDVSMLFIPNSHLNDLYSNVTDYRVIPITPSFTIEKNKIRETEVIQTLQASFGKIFPTDIFNINNYENNINPKFEVYYSYKNNTESLYYNLKESNLPDNQKTFYYGIEIVWNFRISLPIMPETIYKFSLTSQPAQQFSSETINSDAIYSNMALSAFNDFKNEFDKQFLTGK